MSRSLLSWFFLIILCVLAALQIILQLSFWGSLAGHETHNAWLFQGVGGVLTLMEIGLLALASEYDSDGEERRAAGARYLFVFLAIINLAADFTAVSEYTRSSDQERAASVRSQQMNLADADEAARSIASLRAQLAAMNLEQPKAALEAARAPVAERAARFEAIGEAVPIRVIEQLARYNTAIAIVDEIERIEAERTQLLAVLDSGSPDADASGPFAALAMLARVFGIHADSDSARAALAFAVALAVKVSLTVGLWMVAPRGSDFTGLQTRLRQSLSQRVVEEEGGEPSTTDGAGDGEPPKQRVSPLSKPSVLAIVEAWRAVPSKSPPVRSSD